MVCNRKSRKRNKKQMEAINKRQADANEIIRKEAHKECGQNLEGD